MRKNEKKGAKSAKKAKQNNATKQMTNIVSEVNNANVADYPVATKTGTESGKVTSKDVLKSASTIRAAVKEERRGANVTIRLIAELAASGDADAVNILCALCDVPRTALYSLNINIVRNAVNAYYPYYTEVDGRKVSVKPVGVWYSTKRDDETQADASERVQRGYRAVAVVDYLDQLIKAAKSRAKGVTPRRVDADAIYNNIELSETSEGITATEIDDAKKRRAYSPSAANVWKKDRNGFYI